VDHIGDRLFPGAGLAGDQHINIGAGDAADRLEDFQYPRRGADDLFLGVAFAELRLERLDLIGEFLALEEVVDRDEHMVEVEWLGDVVVGPELNRLDRVRGGAIRGHHDDR
jgi:hypothetical protein